MRAGRFKAARERLTAQKHELERADAPLFSALLSDLDLQIGELSSAQNLAERLLHETDSSLIRATAHRILAEASASRFLFEDSLSHYMAARTLCRAGVPNSLGASIELSFWASFSGVLPEEAAKAEFASIRKAVARSSDPHHAAELHLCVARIEARKGSLIEANRHWELARRLIKSHANMKLESELHLDGCRIALLRGDVRTLSAFCTSR